MLRFPMPLSIPGRRTLPAVAALLTVGLAGPAAAGEIYAWRTDDGGYAFTDDEKSIPPRYRDRVEVRPTGRLSDYARFTPQDDGATASYEAQLAARLEHLRALNAQAARPATPSEAAAAPSRPGERITLRTGGHDEPGIDVTIGRGDEPVVVETVLMRPKGKSVSQNVQVTRQGDRTIAIVKPRAREWNVTDIVDEEKLRGELPAE